MTRSIIWFKTDLRLHDNETLVRAISQSDEVIPVYCLDDAFFEVTKFGFKKTGIFRLRFLIESLIDLDNNLRKIGSGLIILKGKPHIALIELAKNYAVHKVFAKKEVAYEELQTQELVEKELWKIRCTLDTYSTSTLYHSQDLPFSIKDIPEVFTNFRKLVEKESTIRKVFATPTFIKSPKIAQLDSNDLQQYYEIESIKTDGREAIKFNGGETEGLKRLNYYLFESKAVSTYKQTRNGLIGENYSSKLSAWLNMGCISSRTIYAELLKYESNFGANESTYWLVFELIWRDYFRFMMKKHGHLFFLQNGIKNTDTEIKKHNPELFDSWKNGTTGIDFIDANMTELNLTGFMSNRGRQNVASFLCHNLNLDWRYGAAYFEQQLVDYDVSNNWGNWAYVAGVGNDPRKNRIFDIEKQANEYDKNRNYVNLWLTRT